MRAIWRLTVAGLWRGHRIASVSTVLVVALATAAVVAALSVAEGTATRLDASFEAGHGSELVVTAPSSDSATISAFLRADPGVTDVGEARPARSVEMVIDSMHSIEHRLTVAPGAGTLGSPVVVTGRLPIEEDEVTIDAALATDRGLGVGDTVELRSDTGTTAAFSVSGTAYDFDDCFHPQCDPARSWVTDAGLSRVGGETFAVIGATLAAGHNGSSIEERLTSSVDSALGFGTWADTRADMLTSSEFYAAFLGAFGVFVLIAAAVVIGSAMTARVLAERRSHGLAMACGATSNQLLVVLLLRHAILAAIGAAVGWVATLILVPAVAVGPLAVTGGSPEVSSGALLPITAAAVLVVCSFTVVPAWRATRVPVVDALRERPRRSPVRRSLLDRMTAVTPASVGFGVRGWRAHPGRVVGSTVALAVALVACVVTLSIDHSMAHLLDNPGELGDPWDVMLEPGGSDRATIEAALDDRTDIAAWYSVADTRVTVAGERLHAQLIGGDPQATVSTLGAGRVASSNGEAVVGFGLFDDEQWSVGQELPVTTDDGSSSLTITGWYRETEDDGRIIRVRDDGEHGMPRYEITAEPGTGAAQLATELAGLGTVTLNEPDASMVRPFRTAMLVMSALLAAVALAHVSATALATARRRARDMAVLRAVGGTPGQAAAVAATGAVITSVLAIIVAVPFGWWLQERLGDAITTGIGAGPGVSPAPPVASIAVLTFATLALSAVIEIVAAARTRAADGD